MGFDVRGTLGAMIDAAKAVVADDWPAVQRCMQSAVEEERAFLAELAAARIDGEIDDDILEAQLRDEERTFAATLLVCSVMTKKMAQDAANAAIDAFHRAVSIAVAAPLRVAGKAAAKAPEKLRAKDRRLNARPDTVDFRDFSYVPTLVEVGTELPLAAYREVGVPILDQGREGACTGFGLATVVHYLLRTRDVVPDEDAISPRMLYAMARRYDEWPGETYEGSSCRGAMKGWH